MSDNLLAQQLLKELANEYIEVFPEKCDDVEDRVMSLQKDVGRKDVLADLFRLVHSLKGTAGTYGFHEVSAICHQFEELITTLSNKPGDMEEGHIDEALEHIDLLRTAGKAYAGGSDDFGAIHEALKALRSRLHQNTRRALVVDPSPLVLSIMKRSLEGIGIDVSTCGCGYEALGHLLRSHYDILVTANNLPLLSGPALVLALKESGGESQKAYAVLVGSDLNDSDPAVKRFDLLLAKDGGTPARLQEHLQTL
jgi:HPt (histidine-containing phosphotransfer) domain-containing protein/CheY-like chemotaxis protein